MGGSLCAVTESVGETKPITVKYFQLREIVFVDQNITSRAELKRYWKRILEAATIERAIPFVQVSEA